MTPEITAGFIIALTSLIAVITEVLRRRNKGETPGPIARAVAQDAEDRSRTTETGPRYDIALAALQLAERQLAEAQTARSSEATARAEVARLSRELELIQKGKEARLQSGEDSDTGIDL
jgi:hypothetical protein